MLNIRGEITETIKRRAGYILKELKPLVKHDYVEKCCFYIGGGCLNGKINDVDIFPSLDTSFYCFKSNLEIISETRNAITYKHNLWPVQTCKYKKESVE